MLKDLDELLLLSRYTEQKEYWLKKLPANMAQTQLLPYFKRKSLTPANKKLEQKQEMAITPSLYDHLLKFTRQSDLSLYIVLLSVLKVLIARYTGEEGITTLSPVLISKVSEETLNDLVFIRDEINCDFTFSQFLMGVRQSVLEAYEHQDYPVSHLLPFISTITSSSRQEVDSLSRIFCLLKNIHPASPLPDLEDRLVFSFLKAGNRLGGEIFYDASRYDTAGIKEMAANFLLLLEHCTKNPGIKLSAAEILSPAERNRLLYDFNARDLDYPKEKNLDRLFAEQAARTPDSIALASNVTTPLPSPGTPGTQYLHYLSSRALDQKSNQLAHYLKGEGAAPGSMVGIMAERSLEMIIGILAILKSGSGYLPLDPHAPTARITYILESCNIKLLVIPYHLAVRHSFRNPYHYLHPEKYEKYTPYPESTPPLRAKPQDWAYVIFTSGSTGMPKGIPISHSNLSPLLHWGYRHLEIGSRERALQNLSYYFDWSVWEIFITLTSGASLYMVANEVLLSQGDFMSYLERHGITILHITPTQWQYLVDSRQKATTLNYLFIGAEKLTYDLVLRSIAVVREDCRIFNMYGPTEATIIAAVFPLDRNRHKNLGHLSSVPIGKAVGNTELLILDKYLKLCPVNIPGELFISGDGLSSGYLNNPEESRAAFIDQNFNTPGRTKRRLYKTGDLAHWLADGNVEFLGRIDHQVKIRGFRIELDEIENRLLTHELVKEAVVMERKSAPALSGKSASHLSTPGENYLCAYIVPKTPGPPPAHPDLSLELKAHLSQVLPDYMIPRSVMILANLPLTPNGKIDRKALPEPVLDTNNFIPPRNPVEEKLARIWAEVLELKKELISSTANFFELGGHSLRATQTIAKIHKELSVKIPLAEVFIHPTIQGLAQYIKGIAREQYSAVTPVEKKEYYPLSSAQKRLYILQQLELANTVYNMPQEIPLGEAIEKQRLENIFLKLISRHESLRTSFAVSRRLLVQRIHPASPWDFKIEYHEAEDEKTIEEINRGFIRPFTLANAPLLRAGLIKSRQGRYLLLIDMHHIICDGISREVLTREFLSWYKGEELPPLRVRYKDYSEWLHRREQQESMRLQQAYWLKIFAEEPTPLNLPTDFPRPGKQVFSGNIATFMLDEKETRELKTAAVHLEVTLYMLMLSIFTLLLAKLSGQEDIVVGTPTGGRRHADLQRIIGMFVNTLALRNAPQGGKTYREFLKEVKTRTLEAFENQDYQFEDLVNEIKVERDIKRNPIFDVMFNMPGQSRYAGAPPISDHLEANVSQHRKATTKFDLNLRAVEQGERLFFNLSYCTALFKPETIDGIIGCFKKTVASVLENPDRRIAAIEIIPDSLREQKIAFFNEELQSNPEPRTIQAKLAGIFREYPHRIAVEGGSLKLSYSELDRRSACFYHWIIKNNIEKETFIGIHSHDRVELVPAMIGILKAACVFVPLDTVQPLKRIVTMIRSTRIRVIFTDALNNDEFLDTCKAEQEFLRTVRLDDSFFKENQRLTYSKTPFRCASQDRVYIYFTSGSTGIPQAILGKNAGFLHFINWEIDTFKVTEKYKFSQLINSGFDVYLRDIFVPLGAGGTICIPENREIILDGPRMSQWIEYHGINLIHSVPSLFRLLISKTLRGHHFQSLKYITLSGEKINPADLKKWYEVMGERIQLVNIYGPTETTLAKVRHFIKRSDIREGIIPLGYPLPNTRIILLDKDKNVCPRGVVGEMYIRTPFRSFGYCNDPELNHLRFIPNPFNHDAGDLIYKTGDLARELDDGKLEFIGRVDWQVKVRGIRIELSEIENHLLQYKDLRQAVVLSKEDESGQVYLCAYLVADIELAIPALKDYLSRRMPGYMIPAFFMQIDKIPLSPNGKLNRRALPLPLATGGKKYIAPRNQVERTLATIWSETLNIDKNLISMDANFFELGGHSLNATLLLERVHKEFNVRIPLAEIFRVPSIDGFVGYLATSGENPYTDIFLAEKKEYYTLSSAQKRIYNLQQMDPASTAFNMSQIVELGASPEKTSFEKIIRKLIHRHESLRTSIPVIAGKPVQRIAEARHVEIEIEYAHVEQAEMAETAAKFVRPFDLRKAPLFRVGVVVSDEDCILTIDAHHIISDGISNDLLIRDFLNLRMNYPLPLLRIQYRDFTEWQHNSRETSRLKKQEAYWLKEFCTDPPPLSLALDYPRPKAIGFAGNSLGFEIGEKETHRLNHLINSQNVTLFMALLTIVMISLHKLTGDEDIVVGTPVAGRTHAALERVIGNFTNTLAIRNFPSPGKTFLEFIEEVKKKTLDAFDNQDYQFEDLVAKVAVRRHPGRHPLFSTVLMVYNYGDGNAPLNRDQTATLNKSPDKTDASREKEKSKSIGFNRKATTNDMMLGFVETGSKILGNITYSTGLFNKETIKGFTNYLTVILAAILENEDIKIKDLPLAPG